MSTAENLLLENDLLCDTIFWGNHLRSIDRPASWETQGACMAESEGVAAPVRRHKGDQLSRNGFQLHHRSHHLRPTFLPMSICKNAVQELRWLEL